MWNRRVGNELIFGTFFIVGDNDTGEDVSLNQEQINYYLERFNEKSLKDTHLFILHDIVANHLDI